MAVTGDELEVSHKTIEDGENRRVSRLATFEEAIGVVGVGQFHNILLLVSGMCVMSAVLETVVIGYLLPSAVCELQLTTANKGLLGAISYIGIVLSSHMWGLVADTRGRRTALLAALILDSATSAISCLSPNFASLVALRFLCGVFTSAPAALSFAYLGEFHSPKTRGKAIIWTGAFPSIGLIILPGVAWLILPQTWALNLGFIRFTSWRLLILLCALTSLITAILLWALLPESPKFLLSRDPQKALEVLQTMYAANTRLPGCNFPVRRLRPAEDESRTTNSCFGQEIALGPRVDQGFGEEKTEKPKKNMNRLVDTGTVASTYGSITELLVAPADGKPIVSTIEIRTNAGSARDRPPASSSNKALQTIWRQTAPLFKPPYFVHTLLVCLLQFGNLASANGLQIWLPDIFNYMAKFTEASPDTAATICQRIATVSAGETLISSDGPCIAEVKDRVFVNNLIIGCASLAAPLLCGTFVNKLGKKNLLICCLTVTGICGCLLNVATSGGQVLGLSSIIVAINAMGIGHISSIVVDLFPTHLRAMAVSLSLMAGRSGSIAGNLLFGALLKTECAAAFYVLGGTLLVCAAMSFTLPKKGKYAL